MIKFNQPAFSENGNRMEISAKVDKQTNLEKYLVVIYEDESPSSKQLVSKSFEQLEKAKAFFSNIINNKLTNISKIIGSKFDKDECQA